MAKKVGYKDFFKDDVFSIPKKGAKEFLEQIQELENGIKTFASNTEKNFSGIKLEKSKDIDNITESVVEANLVFEAFNDTQQERIKVQKEVEKLNQESERTAQQKIKTAKDLKKLAQEDINTESKTFRFSVQKRKEAERLLKQQAKEEKQAKSLNSEYAKQSKRLNELRKDYKDLKLSTGENTDETRELLEEIQELDETLKNVDAEVGQFQRNVGNYPKTFESAKAGAGGLSGFLLGAFSTSLSKSRDEAREFNVTLEQFKNSVGVFAFAIIEFTQKLALPAIGKFVNSAENLFLGLEEKVKQGALTILKLIPDDFKTDGIKDQISSLTKEIDVLSETQKVNDELNKEYSKTIEATKNPFDGVIDRVNKSNDTLKEQFRLQDRLIDTTARLSTEIAKLSVEEELNQQIADDGTKSFAVREQAIRDVIKIQEERSSLELQIAQETQTISELAIKNDFIRRNSEAEFLELQKNGSLRNLSFLKDKSNADKIGLDNLELLTQSTLGLIQAEGDFAKAQNESQKTRDELQQDRLERDLDILLDGFDNQKTINERIIADDKRTFDERGKLLGETVKLGEESFDAQIETIQKFTDENVDANDLINESDSIALNEKIRSLGLSEIIEGRLLEVIRDRKTAILDLNEAETELNEAKLESQQNIADSEQNIQQDSLDLQTELLERRLENEKLSAEQQEEIIEDIFNTRKEAILDQASFEKQQAIQNITDESEKQAKLREIDEKAKNDVIRLEKGKQDDLTAVAEAGAEERAELIRDIANQTLSELQNELSEINQAKNEAIDQEIDDREKNIEKQSELAEKGLDNQLAFEQQKADEALLIKKEQAQKEQRQQEALQLAEAFLEAYISELGKPNSDPALAGGKALASTLVAKGIAKTLVAGSALDGTEDTGSISGGGLDGKGGRLWMLHDNEGVVTKGGNSKYSGLVGAMNNDSVDQWMMNNSHLTPEITSDEPQKSKADVFNSLLFSQIKGLRVDMKNKPVQQVNVDRFGNLIETIYTNGRKDTIKHKTRNRI